MTHPGQRLSALIDGELDIDERERVLGHLARCAWCRDEAAALRTLKRRMSALGEAAAGAGLTGGLSGGLTGRLLGLSEDSHGGIWPQAASSWPRARHDAKTGRYVLAGSVVVFLAGIGTAAFIAGGDATAQVPSPRITPSVDMFILEHANMNGLRMGAVTGQRTGTLDKGVNGYRRQP